MDNNAAHLSYRDGWTHLKIGVCTLFGDERFFRRFMVRERENQQMILSKEVSKDQRG